MAKKILIVEDDKNLLSALAQVFQSRGADILTAQSAAQARQVYAQHKDTIGMVFSDCAMEDKTAGIKLLKEIREADANVMLVLHSGEANLEALAQDLVDVTIIKKSADIDVLESLLFDMERGVQPNKMKVEPHKPNPEPSAVIRVSRIRSWFRW